MEIKFFKFGEKNYTQVSGREAAVLNLLARNHGKLEPERIEKLVATLSEEAQKIARSVIKTPPQFNGPVITRYPYKPKESKEEEFKMIDAKTAREQLEQNKKNSEEEFLKNNSSKISEALKYIESEILKGIKNNQSHIRPFVDQNLLPYVKEILELQYGYEVRIMRSPYHTGSNCNELHIYI